MATKAQAVKALKNILPRSTIDHESAYGGMSTTIDAPNGLQFAMHGGPCLLIDSGPNETASQHWDQVIERVHDMNCDDIYEPSEDY